MRDHDDILPLAVAPELEPQLEEVRVRHSLGVDTPKGELVRLLILDQMEVKQKKVVEIHPEMATPVPLPASGGRKGGRLDPEHAAIVRKNLKRGGNHNIGRKHSAEVRKNMSEAHKNSVRSQIQARVNVIKAHEKYMQNCLDHPGRKRVYPKNRKPRVLVPKNKKPTSDDGPSAV